ncbi:MAG: rRNA methyltransferase [Chloroflexi bacterium]|nr:rRNA methyltransferase [Chloroflexota bacterium]
MSEPDLVTKFRTARNDTSLALIEGIHALRHALRFGATVEQIVTRDLDELRGLAASLAPDIEDELWSSASVVSAEVFATLSPAPPDTGVIAIARRPAVSGPDLLRKRRSAPLVLLESPSRLGNVGATIRVAASAGASGVVVTGVHDPWQAAAIRGAAGLQFALPVGRIDTVSGCRGPLIAVDPEGELLRPGGVPSDAILVFGSERRGISAEMRSQADASIGLPMRSGVSSLNLATAVAIVLYTWRLAQSPE